MQNKATCPQSSTLHSVPVHLKSAMAWQAASRSRQWPPLTWQRRKSTHHRSSHCSTQVRAAIEPTWGAANGAMRIAHRSANHLRSCMTGCEMQCPTLISHLSAESTTVYFLGASRPQRPCLLRILSQSLRRSSPASHARQRHPS